VTMAKRSLEGLRGAPLTAAREKLARYETRLAAALTDSGGNGLRAGLRGGRKGKQIAR
jgi:hypothetical protein